MKLTRTLCLTAAFLGSALLASCASNTQTSQMEKPKSQITVI